MYPRLAASNLRRLAGLFPIVTVTGPRQSGKTTLCRALFADRPYASFESPELREEARRDPAIIHFCTRTKPWHPVCDHPRRDVLAYRALWETAAGDGACARPSLGRRAAEILAGPHRRLLDTTAAAVHAKRRTHALRTMLPEMLRLAILHPWTLVTVPLSVAGERVTRRLRI